MYKRRVVVEDWKYYSDPGISSMILVKCIFVKDIVNCSRVILRR